LPGSASNKTEGIVDSMTITKKNIGERFDDFLKEEGLYEECTEAAVKRLLALQLENLMAKKHLTKTDMARRMKTSRAVINRLLDPDNESVTLYTLKKAASVVGKKLRLEFA
jgi:transcriptional regulator with XRE-family HTH domain